MWMFESLLSNLPAQLSRYHNPPRTHLAESAICWHCFVTHYNTLHIHYIWSVTKLFECLSQGALEGEKNGFWHRKDTSFLLLARTKTAVNWIQHIRCYTQLRMPTTTTWLQFYAKASFSLLLILIEPIIIVMTKPIHQPGVGPPGGETRRRHSHCLKTPEFTPEYNLHTDPGRWVRETGGAIHFIFLSFYCF